MDEEIVHQFMQFMHDARRMAQRRPDYMMYGQGKIIKLMELHSGVSQRELADLAKLKPASLTEAIERLERDGLIQRQRDQQDRRVIRVQLTKQGQTRAQQISKEHQKFQADLLSSLTDEEKTSLIQIFKKLNDSLQTMNEKGVQE